MKASATLLSDTTPRRWLIVSPTSQHHLFFASSCSVFLLLEKRKISGFTLLFERLFADLTCFHLPFVIQTTGPGTLLHPPVFIVRQPPSKPGTLGHLLTAFDSFPISSHGGWAFLSGNHPSVNSSLNSSDWQITSKMQRPAGKIRPPKKVHSLLGHGLPKRSISGASTFFKTP